MAPHPAAAAVGDVVKETPTVGFSEVSHTLQVGDLADMKPGNETNCLIEHDIKFVAGNIGNNWRNWLSLTTDLWILDCVKGMTIPFLTTPVQENEPHPFKMDETEKKIVKTRSPV